MSVGKKLDTLAPTNPGSWNNKVNPNPDIALGRGKSVSNIKQKGLKREINSIWAYTSRLCVLNNKGTQRGWTVPCHAHHVNFNGVNFTAGFGPHCVAWWCGAELIML